MDEHLGLRIAEIGPLGYSFGAGDITTISGERAVRALAILALRGRRGASMDEMVDLCWAARQPTTARRSLANVIRRLRIAIGEDVIVTEGSTYRIAGDVASDRTAFLDALIPAREGLRTGDHAFVRELVSEALGLWRGEPWSNVDDLDLVVADRLVLSEAHRELLTIKAQAAARSDDMVSAIADWEDLVALNPYREASWVELAMATTQASGRRHGLQVIQRARAALADVGLEAGPTLVAAEQRMATTVPPVPSPASRSAATTSAATPASRPTAQSLDSSVMADESLPFVGRADELNEASEMLTSAASGSPSCLLLGGVPGTGKTRLALEALGRHSNFLVVSGRCIDGIDRPLGPFADLLLQAELDGAGDSQSVGMGSAPSVVSDRDLSAPDLERQHRDQALAVARLLVARAGDEPLAVLVDDLHWGSPVVLLVLEILLAETESVPLAIVATYRSNPPDLRNDTEDRIAALIARSNVRHIDVGPLSIDEVASLADHTGIDETAEQLHELTGGNAFFLTETLRSGQAARPGQHLQTLIAARLRALHPTAAHFLAVGAFLGLKFPTGPAADAVGLSDAEADSLIDDLHRAGLLVESNRLSGRSQFSHRLVADAVQAGLGPREEKRLRLALARSLERLGFPITDWVETLLLAGSLVDNQTAVNAALTASSRFLADHNNAATIRIMELVLARDLPDRQTIQALVEFGRAKIRNAQPIEGRVAILRAAEVATSAGDAVGLAEAALAYASGGAWSDNADEVGPELLQRSLRMLDSAETVLRARVVARLSSWAIFTASLAERDRKTADALALARQSGSTAAMVDALNARQLAVSCPAMAEESLRLDDELGQLIRAGVGASELARNPTPATYWMADGPRYRAEIDSAEQGSEADDRLPIQHSLLAAAALHDGRLEAANSYRELMFGESPSDVDKGNWLWLGVAIHWLDGNLIASLSPTESITAELRGLPLRLTLAWLRAEAGDIDGAYEILNRASPARIVALPELFLGGFGLAGAAMAVAALGDPELAKPVVDGLDRLGDQMIGVPWASYPSAPFFLGVLALMDGDSDRADVAFSRAQRIHERMLAPAFVALTNAYWSQALRDADPERSAILTEKANAFADQHHTAGIRILADSGASRFGRPRSE